MIIDCDSCPGRPASCDGCMMTILMGGETRGCTGETPEAPTVAEQRADLLVAIAAFRTAMLVTPAEARAAVGRISPRQDGGTSRFLTVVQAG